MHPRLERRTRGRQPGVLLLAPPAGHTLGPGAFRHAREIAKPPKLGLRGRMRPEQLRARRQGRPDRQDQLPPLGPRRLIHHAQPQQPRGRRIRSGAGPVEQVPHRSPRRLWFAAFQFDLRPRPSRLPLFLIAPGQPHALRQQRRRPLQPPRGPRGPRPQQTHPVAETRLLRQRLQHPLCLRGPLQAQQRQTQNHPRLTAPRRRRRRFHDPSRLCLRHRRHSRPQRPTRRQHPHLIDHHARRQALPLVHPLQHPLRQTRRLHPPARIPVPLRLHPQMRQGYLRNLHLSMAARQKTAHTAHRHPQPRPRPQPPSPPQRHASPSPPPVQPSHVAIAHNAFILH